MGPRFICPDVGVGMKAQAPSMTLGNMRSLGVRVLDGGCLTCRHQFRPGVDRYASDVPVSHFGRWLVCTK